MRVSPAAEESTHDARFEWGIAEAPGVRERGRSSEATGCERVAERAEDLAELRAFGQRKEAARVGGLGAHADRSIAWAHG